MCWPVQFRFVRGSAVRQDMEMCDILCDLAGRDPGCFVSAGKRRMSCAQIPAAGDLCGCCLCEYFDSGVPAERGALITVWISGREMGS